MSKCDCGGKGELHLSTCALLKKEPTLEEVKAENAELRAVLERYIRAVDIAQRVLANT